MAQDTLRQRECLRRGAGRPVQGPGHVWLSRAPAGGTLLRVLDAGTGNRLHFTREPGWCWVDLVGGAGGWEDRVEGGLQCKPCGGWSEDRDFGRGGECIRREHFALSCQDVDAPDCGPAGG